MFSLGAASPLPDVIHHSNPAPNMPKAAQSAAVEPSGVRFVEGADDAAVEELLLSPKAYL